MEEYKCAFNATLMGDQFGCAHARHVVRRGGPDVACADNAGHERCRRLFDLLKASALPAFGVEDDLLSMPHSTLVKIQFGGLLGIQRLLGGGGEAADAPTHMPKRASEASRDTISARGPRLGPIAETVTDIYALVGRAENRFGGLETVPCKQIHTDMTGYKRRRRK